jgi:predicted transcriptional regulator
MQTWSMSNKELVIDLVRRLPDEATLMEIAKEIEFVAGVREGFAQLDRGEGVPLEEVKQRLSSWITK